MLIASNRGPSRSPLGHDGQLVRPPGRRRHGVGPVVGGRQARRAVGVRGAERRRPGGGRGAPRAASSTWTAAWTARAGGADARHPGRDVRARLQRGGQLDAVVRPPPALRHARTSRSSALAFRREWESFRALQRGVRRRAGRGAGPDGRPARAVRRSQDYHLTLVPRMLGRAAARRARSRTSRTPRGRRPSTSGSCPTTSAARCWTASSAPTTPGSSRQRWADAFLDCCEAVLGAEVDRAARHGHATAATRPPSACTRWAWTPPSCAAGPRSRTCRRTSRRWRGRRATAG